MQPYTSHVHSEYFKTLPREVRKQLKIPISCVRVNNI